MIRQTIYVQVPVEVEGANKRSANEGVQRVVALMRKGSMNVHASRDSERHGYKARTDFSKAKAVKGDKP